MKRNQTKRVGYLAFDGMQSLDLFGPMETLQEANELHAKRRPYYEHIIVSCNGRAVTTTSGARIVPHTSIAACPKLHTLIIPGGQGARAKDFRADAIAWIRQSAPRLQRVGSICTGLFILARTGLLDGLRVTTHWQHVEEARQRFPALEVTPNALFLKSDKIFTAAGVTAGIDLALSLVEEDLGPATATAVARQLVVFLKRPGDQRQFSGLLAHQTNASDEFADLIAWVADNLEADLSSFALSERVGLSERQFRRRFSQAFGETPTRYIERLRIKIARQWLESDDAPVSTIACDVGYQSVDTFRRTFERLMGVSPSTYRARFNGAVV